jgi:acyl-CoA reductase-like NAD-dependent aldehyde dehydrogenase
VADAVSAAQIGARRWAATPVSARAAALRRFADILESDADALAWAIVDEVGKRIVDAEAEVAWTVLSARWYADHPPAQESAGGARLLRRPLGVIAAITPWNVPLITPAWKWLPSLIAGNSVVWKPSELATGVAVAAHERALAAGIPDDVFVLVVGGGATSRAVCADERVDGIHFTGSERAGRALAEIAAPRFAGCALEMGGLNPAVVFADADLELTADCIVACATALAGQKCTSTRRVLVADAVRDELVAQLAQRVEGLSVGDPRDPATDVGPLITHAAREAADAALERSLGSGARLVTRAEAPAGKAMFAPTLLTALAEDDPSRAQELFAPVLTVEPFAAVEDAVAAADHGRYGLSAAVYGRDPKLLAAARERIRTGVLAFNRRDDDVALEAPFGGHKHSGNGHPEGGSYVYGTVTELQAVYE